jgi:ABC-2 type transport system ATP-binding protein/lipopolysaccharide transport system ATP-binding protein
MTGARVVVEGVGVDYTIYGMRLLRSELFSKSGGLLRKRSTRTATVRALKDVSFEAVPGDRIALLGRNGAGKTTLLKVLAGIYAPTSGSVRTEGVVSSLLNAFVGLEPDATGYENIRMACILKGLPRGETERIVGDVQSFTELGGFLDMPLRTYSAGMSLRLSFGIATSMEPDILVLDEVLGVGDAGFFQKATDRLKALIGKARILFMSSHAPDAVRSFCNKALLLDQGTVRDFGEVESVLAAYDRLLGLGGQG